VRTADLQRRMLVLHVPTGRGTRAQKSEHAERQCTYRDTPDDMFAPGIRVTPALQGKLDEPELKDILREGFRPRFIKEPKTRQGRNYGGVLEHADKVEAQLQKERGVYNEGPLHYTPFHHHRRECHLLPRKKQTAPSWTAKKSKHNECLDNYGGPFDPLEEALRWQRAACWQSGWDLASLPSLGTPPLGE